ncbi:unnamed protein product [Pleuronectes platessa]|uniref:Uncharacterized protein n=1 Tax=Pleuronectes platessa TaxID=8262 RepID=A0A9N7U686_PLEPL|nr:unnamed protein product [Pleuronectes platessa]
MHTLRLVRAPTASAGTRLHKQSRPLVAVGDVPERGLIDRVTAVVQSVYVFWTDVLHIPTLMLKAGQQKRSYSQPSAAPPRTSNMTTACQMWTSPDCAGRTVAPQLALRQEKARAEPRNGKMKRRRRENHMGLECWRVGVSVLVFPEAS